MPSSRASPVLMRKKSFWQRCRKVQSEDSPLFGRTDSLNSGILENEVSSPRMRQEVTKGPKNKLYRLVDWIKSWSKRKELHQDHTYQQLQSYSSAGAPAAEGQDSPVEFERTPRSLPEPVPALDGANDQLPSTHVSLQAPQRNLLLRHQSHRYLRGGLNPTTAPSLQHSTSSPGFIRRRFSQHFQGTVIRRSGSRPLNILAPLPINFFSDTPDIVRTSSQRLTPTFPVAVPCSELSHPQLRTVEVTTAAKIYLESHFSQLLRFPNSRSMRRRKFEDQLQKSALSEDERGILREEWMKKETAYLRSLRSQSLNVDNYEIVKVIGKGAFGVVKLVRERDRRVASPHGPRSLGNRQQQRPDAPLNYTGGPRENNSQSGDSNGCRMLLSESTAHVPQRTDGMIQPKVYALKVMQKEDMLIGGQEGHLRAERDFLVASQGSRWIVPLVAAFQDQDNLYLVMEYLIGGDLLALLIKRTVLTEEETRFYAAEMICCIEEAHALGYIHRDVKPDNFLFNSQGHLKLCDFGLAFSGHRTHDGEYLDQRRHSLLKRVGISVEGDTIGRKESRRLLHNLNENVPSQASHKEEDNKPTTWLKTDRGLARSIVGTNQYMAPEVVRGDAYDGRCDWWSLGIIIYECLYGFTPFNAGNRTETRQKILVWRTNLMIRVFLRILTELPQNWRNTLTFPLEPKISPQAYHLVASLLCEKQYRLTAKAYAPNGFRLQNDHTEGVNGYGGYIASNGILNSERAASRATQSAIHVLPHDGIEIRAHPFFKGIDWQRLHTMTPPFVPEGLNGADDTKYFEEESYQSTSVNSSSANQQLAQRDYSDAHEIQLPEKNNELNMKKRARDKLLRDPIHGKELLDLRKEVAFWGYTYRRPKTLDPLVTRRRRVTLAGSANVSPAAPCQQLHGVAPINETRDGANSGGYSGTTLDGEESEV